MQRRKMTSSRGRYGVLSLILGAVLIITVRLSSAEPVSASPESPLPEPPTPVVPLPQPTAPPVTPPTSPAPAVKEPTYSFRFDKASWDTVFTWFSRQSGLVLVNSAKPTGTVTLTIEERTLPEVIDLLNEALSVEKFVLIRREQTFSIHPSDEKIDPILIHRITPDQLSKRGKTELVQTVVTLKSTAADEMVPQVKKLLSNFGETAAFGSNGLILQDKAGNIKTILTYLKEIEDDKGVGDALTYPCKFVRAATAAENLRTLLSDKDTQVNAGQPVYQQPQPMPGQPGYVPPQAKATPRFKSVQIAVLEETNSILITGPSEKIAVAQKFLKDIDSAAPGRQQRPLGPPETRVYTVAAGTADAFAKTLTEVYKSSQQTRIQSLPGGNQIMVYAFPADHFDIAAQLKGGEDSKPKSVVEFVTLQQLDPEKTAKTIQAAMGAGGVYVEAKNDGPQPGVLLRGTPEQVSEAKRFIKASGEDPKDTSGGSTIRVIPTDGSSPAILADGLSKMLRNLGKKNPVEIIDPNAPPKKEPKEKSPPKKEQSQLPATGTIPVTADNPPIVAETSDKPLTITIAGDRLILVCDDPTLLDTAAYLARLLTQQPKGEQLFEVIRLRRVSAEDAAKVVNEVFNNVAQKDTRQFNPWMGMQQQPQAAPPTPGRVRVVADKTSNSLIVVKASAADLLAIRQLLEKTIDAEAANDGAVAKSYVITLKWAKAADTADVIRDVFRNLVGPKSGQQQNPMMWWMQQQPSQSNALTVTADEVGNRIVVNCSESIYKEVEALCQDLDKSAREGAEVVRVVPVRGLSPTQVQRAVDALLGRVTQQPQFQQGRPGTGMFQPQGSTGRNRRTNSGTYKIEEKTKTPEPPEGISDPDFELKKSPETTIPVQNAPRDPAPKTPRRDPKSDNDPMPSPPISSPSDDVTVTPLEELGIVIVRGRTASQIDEVLKFIELLKKSGEGARITLNIVPLEVGDATEITSVLNQILSRVQFGAGANEFTPRTAGGAPQTAPPGGMAPGGQPGMPGQPGMQGQQGARQQVPNQQNPGSLFLFALPRVNSILIAGPESRYEDIVKEIRRLDRKNGDQMKPVPYPLRRASAQIVSQQIQNFFNQRYPGEQLAQNQIRVTFDAQANTLYVQASPADQLDIAELIGFLDSPRSSSAVNEVRIFRLKNAFADEASQVLTTALGSALVNPNVAATASSIPTTSTGGAAPGGVQTAGGQGAGARPGATGTGGFGGVGAGGGFGSSAAATGTGGTTGSATSATGLTTKTTTLRFFRDDGKSIESGFLEDVHIVPDSRINALVIAAPEKTMRLIESLLRELDGTSAAKSFVNVFSLKRADAQTTATVLAQLFSSNAASGRTTTGTGLGTPGGLGGGVTTASASSGNSVRPLLTLSGMTPDGATLLDLRITADPRTNSLIVAGSRNDLDTIAAIVAKLEDAEAPLHRTEVFKLRNAAAADVATAVTTFVNQQATLVNTQFQTSYQLLQRQMVVVAEPVSNTLLLSAPPQLFDEIARVVARVDASPPQVVVQVVIAEVQLSNREEFGIEAGLQSPVLFSRSATGTSPGTPGFNFNTTATLPNTTIASQGTVGFQGLGNLGVGRVGSNGAGGLVLSAAGDSVSLLVRALKTQGRVEILSRPQLILTDNQQGFFQVGQQYPLLGQAVLAGAGLSQQSINYVDTGIVLRVTPRIDPDGRVLMRIEPQISNPNSTPVSVGGGLIATAIDIQTLQTTVQASDGETVILGGLIRKSDSRQENKIPLLGDLPWVGAAFRYRTLDRQRRELIIIMTPHIIRSDSDLARVTGEESRRMTWTLNDVAAIHGHGRDVLEGRTCPPPPATTGSGLFTPPSSLSTPYPLPSSAVPRTEELPTIPTPLPSPTSQIERLKVPVLLPTRGEEPKSPPAQEERSWKRLVR